MAVVVTAGRSGGFRGTSDLCGHVVACASMSWPWFRILQTHRHQVARCCLWALVLGMVQFRVPFAVPGVLVLVLGVMSFCW